MGYLEQLLCSLFVVVYAVERFSRPAGNLGSDGGGCQWSRATTTAMAYYAAASLYCAVALGVYHALVLLPTPKLLAGLMAFTPEGAKLIASGEKHEAILVASLVTVLLPKVPLLSAVDEWVRRYLQEMAAIPHEVRRLAAELRRAPYRVTDQAERRELTAALHERGFDARDVVFDSLDTPQARWTKLSALMARIDGWEADPGFRAYALAFPGEIAAFRRRYAELVPRALRFFALLHSQAADAEASAVLVALRDELADQMDDLLRMLYDAASRAVLLCELTHRTRVRRLVQLGFQVDPDPPRSLNLNQLMALFGGLTIGLLLVITAVGGLETKGIVKSAWQAIRIALVYCLAIWCAIYPKSRWSVARPDPETGRPWASYAASSLAAGLIWAVVSLGNRLLQGKSLEEAWTRLQAGSPRILMPMALAFAVAYLADDQPRRTSFLARTEWRLRWCESLALGLILMVAATVMQEALAFTRTAAPSSRPEVTAPPAELGEVTWGGASEGSAARRPSTPPHVVIGRSALFGLAIGFLVPTWYRRSSGPRRRSRDLTGPPAVPNEGSRRTDGAVEPGRRGRPVTARVLSRVDATPTVTADGRVTLPAPHPAGDSQPRRALVRSTAPPSSTAS
jgi:hypothetical protein